MASILTRALLASSPSVLLRASRTGLVAKHVALPSIRKSSAAALKPRLSPTTETTDAGVAFAADDDEVPVVGIDQPEFATMSGRISKDTLHSVHKMKIKNMSPVQSAVLPLLPGLAEPYDPTSTSDAPRDLLVKARTGTGKTLAFLIPAIEARIKALEKCGKDAVKAAGLETDHHLDMRARRNLSRTQVGALIISPTRELATQIANEALKASSCHDGFEVRLFVGGSSKRNQMRDWMRGRRDIVVATPGRMRDLLENEPDVAAGFKECPMLILDEADTLLEMGFREEIQAISDFLPQAPQRQTFLFSATVSREIQQIARATLDKKHSFINCVADDSSPVHAHVPQLHTVLPSAADQIPHILRLLAHDQLTHPGCSKTILFLPTTKQTQLVATMIRQLSKRLLPQGEHTKVYEIHSKRTMESRMNTSAQFRKERSGASILVTSDVSARGVDYPGVTRVIQIGIPSTPEQYVHRVGRTGRGVEKAGRADLVLLPWEHGYIRWQLGDIPMKPLTVTELQSQVQELAAGRDAALPEGSKKGVLERLEKMDAEIKALLDQLDPEAIKETMSAQLGYYAPKHSELRIPKSAIVAGLKQWTVDGCGLANAPYISENFLQKIGMGGMGGERGRESRPRFGSRSGDSRGSMQRSEKPFWMQRGRVGDDGAEGSRGGDRGGDRGGFRGGDRDGFRGGDRGDRRPRRDGGQREGGGFRRSTRPESFDRY